MKRKTLDDPGHILGKLLERCVDGVDGYRRASEIIKAPAWLGRTLATAARDREAVVAALSAALAGLGYVVEPHGSREGAVHRALIETLSVYSPDGAHAVREILHECERGEMRAIEAFSNALGRPLPEDIRKIVQSQLGRLLEAGASLRREIEMLDDTGAAGAHAHPA